MEPQNAEGKGDEVISDERTTTTQVIAEIHNPSKNKDASFQQSPDVKIDAEISGFTEVPKKQVSEDMDVIIDGSPSHSKCKIPVAKSLPRSCLPRKSKARAYEKLKTASKAYICASVVRGRKNRNIKRLRRKPAPRRYQYNRAPKRKTVPSKVIYIGGDSSMSFSSSYGTGSSTSGSY